MEKGALPRLWPAYDDFKKRNPYCNADVAGNLRGPELSFRKASSRGRNRLFSSGIAPVAARLSPTARLEARGAKGEDDSFSGLKTLKPAASQWGRKSAFYF